MDHLVGHLLVFLITAVVCLMIPLAIGRLIRPRLPNPEKDSIYECGEPTIGSSYIQFDLRFYVVALLFIIFDVEVAFFFPWATIFGGAMQLADQRLTPETRVELSEKLLNQPAGSLSADEAISSEAALTLGTIGFADILVFFGVLLVGFAYVWKRGDLDWVRAMAQETKRAQVRPPVEPTPEISQETQTVS